MAHKLKTLALMIIVMLAMAGCAPQQPIPEAEPDLYQRAGITIAIPHQYADKLLIDPLPTEDGCLLSVYQKASFEHKEYPGAGCLFNIYRYSQAEYEYFLCYAEGSGQSFFARDEQYYYGFFVATDVQTPDMAAWPEYQELLQAVGDFVREDMIIRNALTAYGDEEFYSREYTYNGEHLIMRYYPYAALNGKRDIAWTLVLSQPAKHGGDGIWCVERWYEGEDVSSALMHPYFPDTGQAAKEYYAAQQAACDAGHNTALLDPYQVATEFVRQHFQQEKANLDSFELDKGTAYIYSRAWTLFRPFVAQGAQVWYQETFDSEPWRGFYGEPLIFTVEPGSFEAQRMHALCEGAIWTPLPEPVLPTDSAAMYWGANKNSCFIFIMGTDYVSYVEGDTALTWSVDSEYAQGYWPDFRLPMVAYSEMFAGPEASISSLRIKDVGQSHKAIAAAIFRDCGKLHWQLTPESYYHLEGYEVVSYSVHDRIDGVTDEFGVICEIAVKPVEGNEFAYMPGNAVEGEGKWQGWLLSYSEYIFNMEDGYWRITDGGSGGAFMVFEYGNVYLKYAEGE